MNGKTVALMTGELVTVRSDPQYCTGREAWVVLVELHDGSMMIAWVEELEPPGESNTQTFVWG